MPCTAFRRPCATQETSFMNLPIEGRKGGVHRSCVAAHSPRAAARRPARGHPPGGSPLSLTRDVAVRPSPRTSKNETPRTRARPRGGEYGPCLREYVESPLRARARARARFPSWDLRRKVRIEHEHENERRERRVCSHNQGPYSVAAGPLHAPPRGAIMQVRVLCKVPLPVTRGFGPIATQ